MNNCFHIYSNPYNILECFPTRVWDNFCINFPITVEYFKYNCFTTCTSATFTFDSSCSKITFIDFYFYFQGRFLFTEFSNRGSHGCEITVDGVAIKVGKLIDLDCIQIQGKQLDQLPKFLLRNSGTLNIPISHCYCGTYSISYYAN